MWKAASKAFGEAILDVLCVCGEGVFHRILGIYISGVSQEGMWGPL
jgi:hypothetical protein